MTVKELTNILATMPQDALVVTEGYEDGYDAVKNVSVIRVEENPQKEWWTGKYADHTKDESFVAVFLYAGTREDDK